MRYLRLIICIQYLFLLGGSAINADSQSLKFNGDWTTHIHKTDLGAFSYQLRILDNHNFQLYRLNLHPDMRWEEARYEGKWKWNQDSSLSLKPESCRIYTSTDLMRRRALLRSYDCDHIEMISSLGDIDTSSSEVKLIISPNEYGAGNSTHFFRSPKYSGGKTAIVFTDGVRFLAWGIDLKYSKKGQKIRLVSKADKKIYSASIYSVAETALEFKLDSPLIPSPGDFILLQ
ncbi:hypothetical protein [Leptospira sp. GIMC2001]|uniref:hypothetical protein n=1 Tax=Leptospira sp. GIMC2001 TaxID=1513297 RepID=UPI002349A367|nr:hypothetical protein [Leptospira sp. GIMC2001]WCL47555.1 hypothetical protein O4O04_00900 [Leptospira sp. GIMC2001]